MRHGKKFNHLGRTASHRKAMLANMASSLIEHKRINTTVAKAKALQKFIEPLLTRSKSNTTHNRRIVFSYLRDKYATDMLFSDVSPKIASRNGGYTRVIKIGFRLGDAAEMALIELVDFNDLYSTTKERKSTTRRSRRGKKSSTIQVDDKATKTETNPIETSTSTVEEKKDENSEEIKTED